MFSSASVVVLLAFGLACALIAKGRGRSPVAWFFIGWVIHVPGLILLLVLPDRGEEQRRSDGLSKETRRLRERQRLDRRNAERRHEETERRLAVHDRALGLDTAPPAWLRPPESAPPPLPAQPPALGGEDEEAAWYFAREGAPVGPLGRVELQRVAEAGGLAADTLVWHAQLVSWRPAGSVPGLLELQHV